ncbi:MAG: alpha/beta hydrolase [Planctomycetota bacterium]
MSLALIQRLPIPTVADLIDLLPLLGAGLALFLVSVIAITTVSLMRPPRRTYSFAVARNRPGDPRELDDPLEFTDATETHAGCRVAIWSIEGRAPDGPTVILTHGWGQSRLHSLTRVPTAVPHARRVIAWDMPGHGESAGPTSLGPRETASLISITKQYADEEPFVLWGWSLGAEVTLRAAAALRGAGHDARHDASDRLQGIILESAYRRGTTPARGVVSEANYPSGPTLTASLAIIGTLYGRPTDRFTDLTRYARTVASTPLVALHGTHDRVAPIKDARTLSEAASGRLVEFDAGHVDLWKLPSVALGAAQALNDFAQLRVPPTDPAPTP